MPTLPGEIGTKGSFLRVSELYIFNGGRSDGLAAGFKPLKAGAEGYFPIVEGSMLLVESAIDYNNLPFFIEVKFNT
jgi:hypothetical protein